MTYNNTILKFLITVYWLVYIVMNLKYIQFKNKQKKWEKQLKYFIQIYISYNLSVLPISEGKNSSLFSSKSKTRNFFKLPMLAGNLCKEKKHYINI